MRLLDVLAMLVAAAAPAAQPAIPATDAAAAFQQAKALCTADGGRLWGVSLCGPMMFVDPQTNQAVGNEPVTGGRRDGSIYRFALPKDMATANTSVEFQGKRWIQIQWPLPSDPAGRAVLLMHESYHRIQPQLGLTGSGGLGTNGHLDSKDGRIWLRAEIHALESALQSSGAQREAALAAALSFRAARRAEFPNAATQESSLEINEGLAESTGIDAGLPADQRVAFVLRDLKALENARSFVRQMPYGTGTAYAALLDAKEPAWRKRVRNDSDLAVLAQQAYGITALPDAKTELAAYGGAAITAQEEARAQRVAAQNARYAAEFDAAGAFSVPICKYNISFDPRAVEQFAERGSVYHTLRVTDSWGVLDVTGGDALINTAFNRVTLPAPQQSSESGASGPGWNIRLNPLHRLIKSAGGALTLSPAVCE